MFRKSGDLVAFWFRLPGKRDRGRIFPFGLPLSGKGETSRKGLTGSPSKLSSEGMPIRGIPRLKGEIPVGITTASVYEG
jgi:hypothetical protein